MAANDHAVLVGISRYPRLGDLHGTENDAMGFRDWLISSAGGAVPPDQVSLIRSSDYEYQNDPLRAQPTTETVDLAFERLIDLGRREGGRVGRRLYIYLAGHGFAPSVEDVALLMANADRRRMGHHISGRPYASWFRTAALFEEIVLLMDCCRRSYPLAPLRRPPWGMIRKPSGANVRYFYAFATQWSCRTREETAGAGAPIQGLFTQTLLAGLYGGARDEHGNVTAASLEAFVQSRLPRLAQPNEAPTPKFEYDRTQNIVFVALPPPVQTSVRVVRARPGAATPVEILGPNFEIVARHTLQDAVWKVDLPPGTYMIWAMQNHERRTIFTVMGEAVCHVQF